VAALGDEDVGGLDVAVNNAFGVSRRARRQSQWPASRVSFSSGRPATMCFRVKPSRNSIA
jgi:hypothetical protein